MKRLSVEKLLARMVLGAAALIFIAAMIFLALQISGRYRLERQTQGIVPYLSQSDMVEASVMEEENWKDGDVWYGGAHYRYNKDIMTFLLLGIDKMGEVEPTSSGNEGGQADAVFLLALDPHSREISVICINRDTMTEVDVYDAQGQFLETAVLPLCDQYSYGDGAVLSCQRTQAVVSELFYGLPINGYCAVNMGAIPKINDAVGGIELTALEDVTDGIKSGEKILLQGMDAYHYLHDRDDTVEGSEYMRLERQMQYLTAYSIAMMDSLRSHLTLPVTLYNILEKYMVTDITLDEVSYLMTRVADYSFAADHVYSLEGRTVTESAPEEVKSGKTALNENFYADETALYELILDIFYEEVEK